VISYARLFSEWSALSEYNDGWSLSEIKGLSQRERSNWLEVARVRYERMSNG
jgi:hypothetical protein